MSGGKLEKDFTTKTLRHEGLICSAVRPQEGQYYDESNCFSLQRLPILFLLP